VQQGEWDRRQGKGRRDASCWERAGEKVIAAGTSRDRDLLRVAKGGEIWLREAASGPATE
jgi:hypothetical protein